MCGFCGYINKKEKTKEQIKKMTDAISHRGPDDENYYIDDDIAMGFRRLSIIDLKGGRQPMTNENETMVITFNGEIYNFKSIKEDLVKKGHIFKTNADTEVIIHGYEEYGENILSKLRGMFGFVIWDKKKKELWPVILILTIINIILSFLLFFDPLFNINANTYMATIIIICELIVLIQNIIFLTLKNNKEHLEKN